MQQFQWISGELEGSVETLKAIVTENGIKYVTFESGRKIPENKLNDNLVMIENSTQIIDSQSLLQEYHNEADKKSFVSKEEMVFGAKKSHADILGTTSQSKYSNSITVIELVEKQLVKNPHVMDIVIKIPTLKKEYYTLLFEMYPDIKNDLIKIILDKYTSKTFLKEQIENNITRFYSDILLSSDIEFNAEEIK